MKQLSIIRNKQTPKATRRIDIFNDEDVRLMEDVLKFAKEHGGAVGLAANQLRRGLFRINKRFFVYRHNSRWHVIYNPDILSYSGDEYLAQEGCLTWPDKVVKAIRRRKIKLQFNTLGSDYRITQEFSGFEAQVIQHEMNHLNGKKENVVKGY